MKLTRFDRYMLSQLLMLFGFFALVLVSVYWVNRAVILFDRLIADGHSAMVFIEFTALSLPKVIGIVVPLAGFAASVYVTNRLIGDSELTVMQATGFSPWRIARPVFVFGLLLMLMSSILSHVLIPISAGQLRDREDEISGNVSARLLREGQFLHPTKGVTFYVRDITDAGELRDVFLTDRRQDNRSVIYTAARSYLWNTSDGPRLVMLNGVAQIYQNDGNRLATTNFEDFTYDISDFIDTQIRRKRLIRHVPTAELIRDLPGLAAETNMPAGRIAEELHSRFQQPLLSLVAAMIGFSTLLVGGFSRFGVGRQIVGAIFLLVVVKLAESAVTDPVRNDADFWPLIYFPTVVGLGISAALLHSAAKNLTRRPSGGVA
jgi:lipopolysaccharide export system permease protein